MCEHCACKKYHGKKVSHDVYPTGDCVCGHLEACHVEVEA